MHIEKISLLVISSNNTHNMMLCTFLINASGYDVQSALNFEEALRYWQMQPRRFQAVVVDVEENKSDTLNFLDELHKHVDPLPTIMLIAKGEEEFIVESMKAGAKDCLIKFAGYEEKLVSVITQAIEKHKFETMSSQFQKQLEARANHDFLTGTLNRHRFNELFEYELVSARRYKRPLSVVMIDLDEFKQINDKHGHKIGDEALIALSNLLKSQLRSPDLVCRYGGDEFLIVMPETDLARARITVKRINDAIDELNSNNSLPCILSISVGISSSENGYEGLIERADKTMYNSKLIRKTSSSF